MSPISYQKIWPGGNTTALVADIFEREKHSSLANDIIKSDPSVEQVCYLEPPVLPDTSFHLQMAGGEFCGNAARSAAYYWHKKNGLATVDFTVSGYPNALRAEINGDMVKLIIPGSFVIKSEQTADCHIIDLMGIRHCVVTATGPDKETSARLFEKYGSDIYPAQGAIYFTITEKDVSIDPFVFVRDVGTVIHETACASGSIAAALSLMTTTGVTDVEIRQPSGEKYAISITKSENGLNKISIEGIVKLIK